MTEHIHGPSGPGTVVLELGEGVGVLVLDAPPELNGREIEISPSGGGHRTHSLVRERHLATGTVYAAVYPGLAAAEYTVWLDGGTPAGRVTVRGGQATRFRWPEVTPADLA
jgi:hypothetical protein